MWLAFVDDSEEQNPRRAGLGHLVAVGAVLFREEAIAPYADAIIALRDELSIPPDTELKWSPASGSWLKTQQGNAVRTTLRRRMLQLAAEVEARSAVVVWDRRQVPWTVPKVRQEILGYLYERISMCLKDNDATGIVIADEPGGSAAQQRTWLAYTRPLTDYGTDYIKAERVVLPIVTTPSHHVPHLQLADLVTAATTAAVAGNPYALDLTPLLMQLTHRNAYGYAGGAGIVLWPPQLYNLHYHAFGENGYVKVGMNAGWTLPWREWPYADDNGLV